MVIKKRVLCYFQRCCTILLLTIIQLIFSILFFHDVSAQTLDDGLVAHWSFEEAGGITAEDVSVNTNSGTLMNGPSRVTGRVGNALSFDGLDDYVEINDNNDLDLTGGEFTFSAWIYPESYGEAVNGRIVDHGGGSSGEGGWSFLINNDYNERNLRTSVKNGLSYTHAYSNLNSINLNTWQHVATTFQSGTITFYVNGLQKGQTAGVLAPTDRNAPIRIGMRATDFLRAYHGVIDEVRIYNRALTPQDIFDLYNSAPPPPVISDGQPMGELPLETTSSTLSVTTNTDATCKYTLFPDTPYPLMPNTFLNTGGTTHTNPISGLQYIQSRTYYVKCEDQNGISNPFDYEISFYVNNRTVYSVAPSGADSNPGTDVLPLKTIQHAIDTANTNGINEIIIKVAQGTYYENISIVCCSSKDNWQIIGGWYNNFQDIDENPDPKATVINGGGKNRVIKIYDRTLDLTIENLSIRNGFDSLVGGGILVFPFSDANISLSFKNNIISQNRSGSYAGGVYVLSKENSTITLTFSNNVIVHNHAANFCGGICVQAQDYVEHEPEDPPDRKSITLTFNDNVVMDNSAGYHGGGIYVRAYNGAKIKSTFSNNLITKNSAAYFGAGIYVYSELNAALEADFIENRIIGNINPYFGGGVYLHSVSNSALTTSFTRNTISDNTATIHGAGIYTLSAFGTNASSIIANNEITDNSAVYDGGGIFSWGNAVLTSTNNIIARNSTTRGGGVFAAQGSTLTFTNDTITENIAAYLGGGLYARTIDLENTNMNIRNTIVWGNNSTDIEYMGDSTVNVSYSNIGSGTYNDDGHNRNEDPEFVNSDKKYHLSQSSPLIDQGNNSYISWTGDIDGDSRIMNSNVDMGADEYDYNIVKPDILPIIGDGVISGYDAANILTITPSTGGDIATVRAVWINTNEIAANNALYIAYEITDTQLNASIPETESDGDVWNEDSVGWAIDTSNNDGGSGNPNAGYMLQDDYLGIVNILNAKYDSQGTPSGIPASSWNGNWSSEVVPQPLNGTVNDNSDIDNGYTVEVKVPWSELGDGTAPSGGTDVRIGYLLNDKDGSGCSIDPAGTYIDAEYFTETRNEAGNFTEEAAQAGYLGTSYLTSLKPERVNLYTDQTPIFNYGPDPVDYELGMIFTTSTNGQILGVKYFKHQNQTGTHKGRLWEAGSPWKLLASATYTNETSSGWQTVYFDSPVSVSAGTTYAVTYYAGEGYNYEDNNYGAVSNSPLATAPGNYGIARSGYSYQFDCAPTPCTPAKVPDISSNNNFWTDVIYTEAIPDCADISGREYKKYTLTFPAGTYTVWLRGYASANSSTALVGVDIDGSGSCLGTYSFETTDQWSWTSTVLTGGSNSTGLLSAETHHIDIWAREKDLLIDGIYLTTGAETPTDAVHGTEIDPSNCGATSHTIWPAGGGTAFDNASNWLLVQLTESYYCDDDHDGFIDSNVDSKWFRAGYEPAGCQTSAGDDCNDNNFYEHPGQMWYKDFDDDGYGDTYAAAQQSCTRPQGYKSDLELTAASDDCDDTDGLINPDASEIWYDGVDQDCDQCNDYDMDKDGFVNEYYNVQADDCLLDTDGCCSQGINDCDDTDPDLNPETPWYPDFDGDTYGNEYGEIKQCTQPSAAYIRDDDIFDCDDNNANLHPGGKPVRVMGTTTKYHTTLLEAYNDDNTVDGSLFECQVTTFEGMTMDLDKSVLIRGGYDCAYSVISGITTINGDMSVTNGSVTIENFKIQYIPYGWLE